MTTCHSGGVRLIPVRRRRLLRTIGALVLGLWVAAGAVLFLWPHGHQLHRLHLDIWLFARDHGLPQWVTPDQLEQVFNALAFIPPVLVLCLLLPHVPRSVWILAALMTSLGIETVQMLALPDRRFDWWDVLGNTCGALIAVVLAMLISGLAPLTRAVPGALRDRAKEAA